MSKEVEKKMSKEERDRAHRLKKKRDQKERKKTEKIADSSNHKDNGKGNMLNHTEDHKIESEKTSREQDSEMDSEVEYIYESEENILTGLYYDMFKDVFKRHAEKSSSAVDRAAEEEQSNLDEQKRQLDEQEEKKVKRATDKLAKEQNKEKLSRKQRKQNRWLQVAQLKALVKRPDLVEAWDITAPDPKTLVFLKSQKNTVPVPRHWSQKRKFLQNKRGVLKESFRLPEYIENTGIARLRDPFSERDGSVMVKQKLRDRMNPKMGKIEIDYDVLHDAFFKYQTKSKLSIHGDIYFEGKEDECSHKKYKPGKISDALRQALELQDYTSPPWLASMQRYGPPPSYPNLKIIGLTYNDQGGSNFINKVAMEEQVKQMQAPGVYGHFRSEEDNGDDGIPVPKGFWGQVIEDDDNNQEENPDIEPEDQDQDEDDLGDEDVDFEEQLQSYDKQQQQGGAGQSDASKHGIASTISGYETPDVDLRTQPSVAPLYHVLEQVQNKNNPAQIMGTQHTYVMHQGPQN